MWWSKPKTQLPTWERPKFTAHEIITRLGGESAAYGAYFDGTLPDDLRDAFLDQCYSSLHEADYRTIHAMKRLEKLIERVEAKL